MMPEDMTAKECIERAQKVYNNSRIDESPKYWIDAAHEKMEDDE